MAATIKFDQAGLPAGINNRSRSDIVAGTAVTITSVTPGSVETCELLWKPPEDDTAAITGSSPTWSIVPKTGTYGTYRIKLTVDGAIMIKTFTVLSPRLGLAIPAANEKADPTASLIKNTSAEIEASETNEAFDPFTSGSAFGHWPGYRALMMAVEESGGVRTTEEIDYYVRAVDGDDSNPGTEASPFQTITKPLSLIRGLQIDHPVRIHVGPHTGNGYAIPEFLDEMVCNKNVYIIGDGAGAPGEDGFNDLIASTAMLAGSTDNSIKSSGLTLDAYNGKTIEVLDGAAAGDRRTIRNNDTTDYFCCRGFSATPSPGDLYRIVEPNIVLDFTWTSTFPWMCRNCGVGDRLTAPAIGFIKGSKGIWLVNFKIADSEYDISLLNALSSQVFLFGIEFEGNYGGIRGDESTIKMGIEEYSETIYVNTVPSAFNDLGAVDEDSWSGWGCYFNIDTGMTFSAGNYYGTAVFKSVVSFEQGFWWHMGGNLAKGFGIVRPSFKYTYVLLYPEPYVNSNKILCGNNAGVFGITECLHVTSGFVEAVRLVCSGPADGLVAEEYGQIMDTWCEGTVGGIGAKTRANGHILYDHAPAITGTIGDLSADNGATTSPKSTLTAAYSALIDPADIHGRIFRNENI